MPGGSLRSSWKSAECSESTGITRAPVASASCITSSPPTTRLSLFASATSMPSPSAATVGPSPAEPTSPFSTRSAPDSATSRTTPSAPDKDLAAAPRRGGLGRRRLVGEADPPHAELLRLRQEALPAAGGRQADDLRGRRCGRPRRAPARRSTRSSRGSQAFSWTWKCRQAGASQRRCHGRPDMHPGSSRRPGADSEDGMSGSFVRLPGTRRFIARLQADGAGRRRSRTRRRSAR